MKNETFTEAELAAARADLEQGIGSIDAFESDFRNLMKYQGDNPDAKDLFEQIVTPLLESADFAIRELVKFCIRERAARIRERLSLVLSVDTAEALRREDYVLAHVSRVMSQDTLRKIQDADERVDAAESLAKFRDAEHLAATQALEACGIVTDDIVMGIRQLAARVGAGIEADDEVRLLGATSRGGYRIYSWFGRFSWQYIETHDGIETKDAALDAVGQHRDAMRRADAKPR